MVAAAVVVVVVAAAAGAKVVVIAVGQLVVVVVVVVVAVEQWVEANKLLAVECLLSCVQAVAELSELEWQLAPAVADESVGFVVD